MSKKIPKTGGLLPGHGEHGSATMDTIGKGVMMSAGYSAGRGLLSRLFSNPWVTLGIGVAVGYLAHKHHKEITRGVANIADMGRDMVMEQRERLTDILEEAKESQDDQASEAAVAGKKS